MYAIYADGVCIYNDIFSLDSMKVVNPKLTLEDNSAGSLEMTLPATNIGYSTIQRLVTDISVQREGIEIWSGRVLSEGMDFWNNRVLYCEGDFAYFNDTTQPPAEYSGSTIQSYLEKLLAVHNSKVPSNRQIQPGAVTVETQDSVIFYTNYEKTIELLNSLVENFGGHLRVRKENGIRYLDYLKDYPNTTTQLIQFGSNLIDFTREWNSSEFATVIVPLGARQDDSEIEALDAYLTVKDVNGGSIYVKSDEAVASFGWIEKVVKWDDETDASALLTKAQEYLKEVQFDNVELELSVLDLHYLNPAIESVDLLDEIRVVSRPHGLDRIFPVKKLEIPLDNPDQTKFTLGDTVKTSLTDVNNQTSSEILDSIEKLPKAHSLLKEAKENATQIMKMATTGFITITQDEYGSDTLYISNTRDYTAASKLWKWNMNGLGYSNDGGQTFGLAITMDGSIVADYITAGTLSGDRVRTGIIQDEVGNVIFDLNTGKLTMKQGSIDIGNGTFKVDEQGNLTALRGTFAGTLSAAKGTFGGVVQATDYLDADGNSMLNALKQFTAKYLDIRGLNVNNKFKVDEDGNVTIVGGNITMNGGSISWENLDDNCQAIINSKQTTLPRYIKSTYIDSTDIISPTIAGEKVQVFTGNYTLPEKDDETRKNTEGLSVWWGNGSWTGPLIQMGGYNYGSGIPGAYLRYFSSIFEISPHTTGPSINFYQSGDMDIQMNGTLQIAPSGAAGKRATFQMINTDIKFGWPDRGGDLCTMDFTDCTVTNLFAVFA